MTDKPDTTRLAGHQASAAPKGPARRRLVPLISRDVIRPPELPPLASHAELSTLLTRARELEAAARSHRTGTAHAASKAHDEAFAARDRHEAALAMVRALDRLIYFEPRPAVDAPTDGPT